MYTIETIKIERSEITIDLKEALRYIGYRESVRNEAFEQNAAKYLKHMEEILRPRACCLRVPVSTEGSEIDFSCMKLNSASLAKHLSGCGFAYLLAATAGPEVDRMIARVLRNSIADGVLIDALGSAAIEAVCNRACEILAQKEGMALTSRFSPGYGDLPLETQPEFIRVLDTNRKIGMTVTEGLMMTPTKSVTAVAGIRDACADNPTEHSLHNCENCGLKDCIYRK